MDEFTEYTISDYWRLADELTVKQAAFLIIGIDPASKAGEFCEGWKMHERPYGYEAAKAAVQAALRSNRVIGTLTPFYDFDINGNPTWEIKGSVNIEESTVERESLINWLASRGIKTGFFFPEQPQDAADYLDPNNPRYSPRLAAAVRAWQSITDPKGKTPKQALTKWLRENAASFELTNDDGNPLETAIEEIAKVANWDRAGGAPKTPGG